CKALQGIDFSMPMASAQVKSALLLAGLYAQGHTRITEPAPTRDHTERMLGGFGVRVHSDGPQRSLHGGQQLQACAIDVPADISSAAFFLVAASIVPGSDLSLEHVGINPTRTGIIQILELMGAEIDVLNPREVGGEPVADLRVRASDLQGIEVPQSLVPLAIDEFPVLFVAACFAKGQTIVRGGGAKVRATPDGMVIDGQPDASLNGCTIDSQGDHRIAMAFSVAAQRARAPLQILDTSHVATSFPGFVRVAQASGMRIEASSTTA
ncbi:MAG: bifunctional prephenate dehydrogenase/3-phosphoshikimate 1-carboxyvinyltransferase, partial [Betaproteobacteria bacterium]|nr:bifunctional prephenate dehydrogenase/3-phosphoshikimate 1-carboxyvinyltransferase [Betaproteobacteria bacterium]